MCLMDEYWTSIDVFVNWCLLLRDAGEITCLLQNVLVVDKHANHLTLSLPLY